MRILLIEDDAPLAESTIRALQAQGFNVDHTTRGEQAAPTLAAGGYDAMVLDVGLPGIDGFEALRRVREAGVATPVLMLTARDAVPDRVRALDAGADDYLVKPFALAELSARLKALVRRSQQRLDNVLAVGKLKMDLGARRAFVDGAPFELSVREWGVLECLLGQQGKVVSKD
ncbi:MAG: response regulator transcription factor, partial [Burkholderiaceae bacterium]|nr:response regulator transcription factor [Burkholderiaceae bacterium]